MIAEQCVQATQYEAASALPPVCRETRTEMANRIVVQCVADSEKKGTLVIRVHFAAFVRCLEVKRQCEELCVAVSLRNVRCTSDVVGKLTCSGRCTAGFSPHTELSSTSLGSRPSAITMFNLPMAVPLGQRCRAWLSEPMNLFTKPLSTSSCTSLLSSAGLFSAASQLPLQCSSDAGLKSWLKSCEKSKESCAGGHCPLPGRGPKAPVGTAPACCV